jgi:serine phosphatase RsbU (regulator of sigma subunit)
MVDVVEASRGHSAQAVQDGLLAHLQQFMGDEPQFDDITLVAIMRDP